MRTFFFQTGITALGYLLLGVLGLSMAIPPGYASPVFPAAGLALAAVLRLGWPAVLGVGLGSAALNTLKGASLIGWQWPELLPPLTISLGAVLQAVVGAVLVRRLLGSQLPRLETERQILGFLLLGGVVAGLVSALVGTTTLRVTGILTVHDHLFTAWTWYVGDVLGILVFAPLCLTVLSGTDRLWKERRRRVALPILGLLLTIVAIFQLARHYSDQDLRQQLSNDTHKLGEHLTHHLIAHGEALSGVRHLIESLPDASAQTIETFMRAVLRDNADLSGLSVNDVVLREDRSRYERQHNRWHGRPENAPFIRERGPDLSLVPAADRPLYVVVRHIAPIEGNEQAVGFDIHSEPLRKEGIERALRTGELSLTPPVPLVQGGFTTVGVLELLPLRAAPLSGAAVTGFAVGVLSLGELLGHAWADRPQGLSYTLTDDDAVGGSRLLHASDDQGDVAADTGFTADWRLNWGGRTWVLKTSASQAYLERHRSWTAWVIGAIGLAIAATLQFVLLGLTGRTLVIRRKDDALQASEARFRHMFNVSLLPTWIITPAEGRFLAVNDQAVARYGYSSSEFLDLTLCDLRPASEPAGLRPAVGETLRRHRLRDGSEIDVRVLTSAIELDSGPALMQMVLDVTESLRRDVEGQVALAVLRNASEAVIVTDADRRVLQVNPAVQTLLGYAPHELLGRDIRTLGTDQQDPDFFDALHQQLESTGLWQGEFWLRRKNGETRPDWLSISAIRDDHGRIVRFVGQHAELSEHWRPADDIDYLRLHDPLTGLPNRLLGLERIAQCLRAGRSPGGQTAVLHLDIDNMSQINSRYGAATGDELLRVMATRLTTRLAPCETAFRIESDRFALVLGDSDMPLPARCADLLARLRDPVRVGGQEIRASASLGVALSPSDGDTPAALLRNAQTARQAARRLHGHGCWRFFSESLNQHFLRESQLRELLAKAASTDALRLFYQPIVALDDGRVVGVDAQLRWQHPTEGLLPPEDILPLADRAGLTGAIGTWTLRQAAWQALTWQALGLKLPTVAVNLSAQDVENREFETRLMDTLNAVGLPAHGLELDVDETIWTHASASALEMLARLRTRGVQLAVDGLGNGPASLVTLQGLGAGRVKLARRWVDGLAHRQDHQALVRATAAAARALGLEVVAQGVEDAQTAALLRQLGCHAAQGHLWSRPLLPGALEDWLRTRST